MKSLIKDYNLKKPAIRKRLAEFSNINKLADKDIFAELSFCLLTPGTKAVNGDKAVKKLKETGLLFKGSEYSISKTLRGLVRFHNNKASYIVGARNFFKLKNSIDMKGWLCCRDTVKIRSWLVKNIKGLGYKEASHFLRNIGFGKNIAILDTHILKNLKQYKVISEIPSTITKKRYLDIEDKMRRFSHTVGIPIEELDLLFWSRQTGFIFK